MRAAAATATPTTSESGSGSESERGVWGRARARAAGETTRGTFSLSRTLQSAAKDSLWQTHGQTDGQTDGEGREKASPAQVETKKKTDSSLYTHSPLFASQFRWSIFSFSL